jgi:hypothetical protein
VGSNPTSRTSPYPWKGYKSCPFRLSGRYFSHPYFAILIDSLLRLNQTSDRGRFVTLNASHRHPNARALIVSLLLDGKEQISREVAQQLGFGLDVINTTILRAWQKGELLRTKKAIFEKIEVPKGRLGIKRNIRGYHKYTVPVTYEKGESFTKDGSEYVSYSEANLDHHRPEEKSKSQLVIDFLRDNSDKAWFSTQVRKQQGEDLIKACDVMTGVRSRAKKGWAYVRGYTTDSYSTPFRECFLLTWIDQDKPQEQAIKEAFERTEVALSQSGNSSPIATRIHRFRGLLIEAARAKR